MTKLVPITYRTKPQFTDQDFREHARLLADKIEQVPASRHYQAMWTSCTESECKTTGCALGIAVLSHLLPGLQFRYGRTHTRRPTIDPTIDGVRTDWETAGIEYFGSYVFRWIFEHPHLSREQVISRLRTYAGC